jgi:pimeloyl-ACP methyl ester carboxylesterase
MAMTVAVLVPGIMGSQLVMPDPANPNKTIEVWPENVLLHPTKASEWLDNDEITAGPPLLSMIHVLSSDFIDMYGGITNYFKDTLQYTCIDQTQPLPNVGGNLFVGFGYDWRNSNITTAKALGNYLSSIVGKYGSEVNIWLIGHSMGGLVSRYLLESGLATGASWKVQGLITLGTPHLGAPVALGALTDELYYKIKLPLGTVVQQVMDLPGRPAGYELLPPPQRLFVHDKNTGQPVGIYPGDSGDLYELLTAPTPKGYGALADSFQDAQAFFDGLDYTSKNERPPYYVVYGSKLPTVTSISYDPTQKAPTSRFALVTELEAGDAVVPQTSALFTDGWVTESFEAAGVNHVKLPNDTSVLGRIAQWVTGGTKTGYFIARGGTLPRADTEAVSFWKGTALVEALERLSVLRERGHLSEEEFKTAKRRLLD